MGRLFVDQETGEFAWIGEEGWIQDVAGWGLSAWIHFEHTDGGRESLARIFRSRGWAEHELP